MDGVSLYATGRDRLEKLKELRRAQDRIRHATSFDHPFLGAFCTQVTAVTDAIAANHR